MRKLALFCYDTYNQKFATWKIFPISIPLRHKLSGYALSSDWTRDVARDVEQLLVKHHGHIPARDKKFAYYASHESLPTRIFGSGRILLQMTDEGNPWIEHCRYDEQ